MQDRKLEAYSFSYGQSLLYNNIFPKHRERLDKRLSDLVQSVGKADLSGEQFSMPFFRCQSIGEQHVLA